MDSKEAIVDRDEDLQDLVLAEERAADIKSGIAETYSLEDVMKRYGS